MVIFNSYVSLPEGSLHMVQMAIMVYDNNGYTFLVVNMLWKSRLIMVNNGL